MDRNTGIAIILSIVIWLGYFYLFPPEKGKKPESNSITKSEALKGKEQEDKIEKITPSEKIDKTKKEVSRKKSTKIETSSKAVTGAKIEFKTLESETYKLQVSSQGGNISSFRYKKYQETPDKAVELVIQNEKYPGPKMWFFDLTFDETSDDFFSSEYVKAPAHFALTQEETTEKNQKVRILRATTRILINKIPAELIKEYKVSGNDNFFQFRVIIKNLSRTQVIKDVAQPMLLTRGLVGPNLDLTDPYNPIHSGYYTDKEYVKFEKEKSFFGSAPPALTRVDNHQIHWFAIHSRYFLLCFIPGNPVNELWADTRPNSSFVMSARLGKMVIEQGGKFEKLFYVFLGEKEKNTFAKAAREMKPLGYTWANLADSLKTTIDVHWTIEIVRDLLVRLLVLLNSLFGNYGVSLIIFAVLTKLIFWPLNQKSANSMKKMSELAPQLKALKERYKDNPTELNKQTMDIYKRHGVNPASGCLPIVIQMPFFFALYSALSNSVELWNAPFILWITDLSKPDTVTTLPAYLGAIDLNILPLLMVVSQFFQQRLTSSTADPNQQKMMMFLPILFIFIFWKMPSGLVLYWTVQNVFSIGQQLYTNYHKENNKGKEESKVIASDSNQISSSKSRKSKKRH
jgi:YidC/Oxa1 family membrane protein insertase